MWQDLENLYHHYRYSWRRFCLCIVAGIVTVLLWLYPLNSIANNKKGYLMNFYSIAFVGFVLLNLITVILNLGVKLFEMFYAGSQFLTLDYFFHFLTLLGGGPANTASMIAFCHHIYEPKYQHCCFITSCLHILLIFFFYHGMYIYL